MPNKKYFQPLDFRVQVGGYVSSYQEGEEFPYPSRLLSQSEQGQIKTLWEMFVGVNGKLTGPAQHVISNKFADPTFASQFEDSFRDSLNKKLAFVFSEMSTVAIIAALYEACEKYQIRFGDKSKFKKLYFHGIGRPKIPKELAGIYAVIRQFSDFDETQKTFISRLLGTTKPGLKKGAKKTPKVLVEKKGRTAKFKSREHFFRELYKAINESNDPTLARIAGKFKMSKDALNDLRKQTYGDTRTWSEVKREAVKK